MPVIVNGVEIEDEAVFAEMQYHPAATAQEAQYKAALALTIRELLLQEAVRLGIVAPEDNNDQKIRDEFLINRVLEREVQTPEPDEMSCRTYYNQNQKMFSDTSGKPVPFDHVRGGIAAFLKDTSRQIALRQYLKILAGRSRIAGIYMEGADSPLVQV